jgi:hypothetical protein
MVKRCAFLVAGLAVMSSSMGCCCGLLHGGYNRCNPCGAGYGAQSYPAASPCGPAGCAPSYYPPTGGAASYYQGYGSSAYIADPAISTATPAVPGAAFPATALAPMNSLPTY